MKPQERTSDIRGLILVKRDCFHVLYRVGDAQAPEWVLHVQLSWISSWPSYNSNYLQSDNSISLKLTQEQWSLYCWITESKSSCLKCSSIASIHFSNRKSLAWHPSRSLPWMMEETCSMKFLNQSGKLRRSSMKSSSSYQNLYQKSKLLKSRASLLVLST